MFVVFRVDASLEIGTGHVMRCLTLAERLRAGGASCRFISRAHPGNLNDRVREQGFELDCLPPSEGCQVRADAANPLGPAYAAWLGADWEADAQQTLTILARCHADWLVVDHYGIDARWEAPMRHRCARLMAIDDLADRAHCCDLLLDQNLGRAAADYAELVPASCNVFAGPSHAILRPEFSMLRSYSLQRRAAGRIANLLIFLGGVDKENVTGEVLSALKKCDLPAGCRITVVMGRRAPALDAVREQAAAMPRPTQVRVDVADMARLMADSDLAIGAAGTTAWERCCLGLPTLTVILAENQRSGARALHAAGAVYLFERGDALASSLAAGFAGLRRPEALSAMQHACSAITDGGGADRLVAEMVNGMP